MRCVGGSDRRRPGGPRPLRRSIGWFPEKEREGFIELLACCQYSSRARGDPSQRNDYSHRKQETYQPDGSRLLCHLETRWVRSPDCASTAPLLLLLLAFARFPLGPCDSMKNKSTCRHATR